MYARLRRGGLLAVLVLILFTSCPSPVDWSIYEGVNLIAARGFGDDDGDTGAPWAPAPGLTTAGGGEVDFVRFERVTDVTPPADAPEGTQVWRYEVVNLFKNGDFEDGGLAGWSSEGSPSAANATITTASPISGGRSLSLNFFDKTAFLWTDLQTQLIGGFPEAADFAWHIDFKMPTENFGVELNDGSNPESTASVLASWSIDRGAPDAAMVFSFPGAESDNPARFAGGNALLRDPAVPARTRFSIGGLNAEVQGRVEGLFDNLRVVRSNQNHYLRLPVPLAEAGRPEIVAGGTYTFSVYVRRDPTAGGLTTTPAATLQANRFAARHFAVGIDSVAGDRSITRNVSTQRRHLEPEVNVQSDTWHRMDFEFAGHGVVVPYNAQPEDVIFDVVIEIGNYSGGSDYRDAGSLLLAAPQLTWSPVRD